MGECLPREDEPITAFQSLAPQAQAVALPVNNFYSVAPLIAEHPQRGLEDVALQSLLHDQRQRGGSDEIKTTASKYVQGILTRIRRGSELISVRHSGRPHKRSAVPVHKDWTAKRAPTLHRLHRVWPIGNACVKRPSISEGGDLKVAAPWQV